MINGSIRPVNGFVREPEPELVRRDTPILVGDPFDQVAIEERLRWVPMQEDDGPSCPLVNAVELPRIEIHVLVLVGVPGPVKPVRFVV